jgi:hypothetical protein
MLIAFSYAYGGSIVLWLVSAKGDEQISLPESKKFFELHAFDTRGSIFPFSQLEGRKVIFYPHPLI